MLLLPRPSYHTYDVTDYLAVDPQCSILEAFKALVQDCHTRGIRCIIDLPLNHTSPEHSWSLAACEAMGARELPGGRVLKRPVRHRRVLPERSGRFPASQAKGYIAATLRSKKPAANYVKKPAAVLNRIPLKQLASFLSNHDMRRLVGSLRKRLAPQNVKFDHVILAMMGGNTFTYYGEEIGMI